VRIRISTRADRDLDEIIDYSTIHWGADEAIDYVASFRTTFDRIARNTRLGTLVTTPTAALGRVRHREHHVFYAVGIDEVLIVRILHVRMDHTRHLG